MSEGPFYMILRRHLKPAKKNNDNSSLKNLRDENFDDQAFFHAHHFSTAM